MASIRQRNGRISVVWREPSVSVDASGVTHKTWVQRERPCPSLDVAKKLRESIEEAGTMGKRWRDARVDPTPTIGAIIEAYVDAGKVGNQRTAAFRASTLQRFHDFAGTRLVTDLSSDLLRRYAVELRDAGLSTYPRYVAVAEQCWLWAKGQPSRYNGVPDVERITGNSGELRPAGQRIATDTPDWDDVDRMIEALSPRATTAVGSGYGYRPQWELHRRLAVFQRYTGLRISQILNVQGEDIDLGKGTLIIRAGYAGAKGQRGDVIVPIHRLLIEELKATAATPIQSGPLFAKRATKGAVAGKLVIPRGAEVAEVFANAWHRAGVSESKWGAVGRDNARPTNAIRACWKSTIAGASDYLLATLMVGQSVGKGEHSAYVALGNPKASPYWVRMVNALEAIPAPAAGLAAAPWDAE